MKHRENSFAVLRSLVNGRTFRGESNNIQLDPKQEHLLLKENYFIITPVSYTHLDVYKRQMLLRLGKVININNETVQMTQCKHCLLYTSRCV